MAVLSSQRRKCLLDVTQFTAKPSKVAKDLGGEGKALGCCCFCLLSGAVPPSRVGRCELFQNSLHSTESLQSLPCPPFTDTNGLESEEPPPIPVLTLPAITSGVKPNHKQVLFNFNEFRLCKLKLGIPLPSSVRDCLALHCFFVFLFCFLTAL